jgi:hypothetical protein
METPVQPEQPASQDEPKQVTPKGLEIPVPTRDSIFAAFRKIIGPVKKP